MDIRLEIKPETESAPGTKNKKPSPPRLRQNQRQLLMLLERDKVSVSTEPDNSGTIVVAALEKTLHIYFSDHKLH